MFEGTKVSVHKTENGYAVKKENTCHDDGGIRVHVFPSFGELAGHLMRQFGEEAPANTCERRQEALVPWSEYEKLRAAHEETLNELNAWRELHDGAPLDIVRRAKEFARTVIRSAAETTCPSEEQRKRSEQARKAAQARHSKAKAPKKR